MKKIGSLNSQALIDLFLANSWDEVQLEKAQNLSYALLTTIHQKIADRQGITTEESQLVFDEEIYHIVSVFLDCFKRSQAFEKGTYTFSEKEVSKLLVAQNKERINDSSKMRFLILCLLMDENLINTLEHIQSPEFTHSPKSIRNNLPESFASKVKTYVFLKKSTEAFSMMLKKFQSKKDQVVIKSLYFHKRFFSHFNKIDLQLYQFPSAGAIAESSTQGPAISLIDPQDKTLNQLFGTFSGIDGSFQKELTILNHLITTRLDPWVNASNVLLEKIQELQKKLDLKNEIIFYQGGLASFEQKLWVMAAKRSGNKFIQFQIGGRPGYKLERSIDEREILLIDHLFIWSRTDQAKNNKLFQICPDPKLSNTKIRPKKVNLSDLKILISPAAVSVLYRVETWTSITGDKIDNHQKVFQSCLNELEKLDDKIKISLITKFKSFSSTVYKNHENFIFPIYEVKKANNYYSDLGFPEHYFPLVDMHICDSLSTTFFESMAANIPTLVFWNRDIYFIRDEYKALYSKLEEAGIVFSTPEQFIKIINKYVTTPNYWQQKHIQDLRTEFCQLFAFNAKSQKKVKQEFENKILELRL